MSAVVSTRDPDLTRSRILEAAHQLFVIRGFADVSIREIAELSGVNKSLIHHYFGSKEGLWEEVKDQAFALYAASQKAELEKSQTSKATLVQNSVIKYFKFLQEHPDFVRLFAWSHLEGDSACSRHDGELIKLAMERIMQSQDEGAFRKDVNPTHVVAIFVSACTQWFEARNHHRHWPGIGDDESFLNDFLKIFFDGLAPKK